FCARHWDNYAMDY
nr:immunoglobulin heavy chain junction region [Mus musculus]